MSDAPETPNVCVKPPGANHITGYRTYGCRCSECRRANADAMRAWRWRTGGIKYRRVPVTAADREGAPPPRVRGNS